MHSSPPRRILLRLLAVASLALLFAAAGRGDTFVLKDGRRLEGELASQTESTLRIRTAHGEIEVPRADVVEILKGKTPREIYAEREAAAKTAGDFFELGEWAGERKLRSLAKRAFQRAIELDPRHAQAHRALGHVLWRGEWMTPVERDRRAAEANEDEMRAKGLVPFGERWVTPQEREHLERGEVFHEGRWMSEEEVKRLQGLELFAGEWLPRPEALARADFAATEIAAGVPLEVVVTKEAALAGTYGAGFLRHIGEGLAAGRSWFDGAFGVEPGLALFGGRLPEIYAWAHGDAPYLATVEPLSALTATLPEGWAAAAKKTHGFYWIDPFPVSSARVWHRDDEHLAGHCVHHWGHLLLDSLEYDGRLLPPWYDEGAGALCEFRVYGKNRVFCRASLSGSAASGTRAGASASSFAFDFGMFREGGWRAAVKAALEAGRVDRFDRLAQLQLGELELLDIGVSMAILEWLESLGDGALRAFHSELRKSAPPAPARVLEEARERQAAYDAAFGAAAGVSWREADQRWRAWFLSR